jgi:hypothetical protein
MIVYLISQNTYSSVSNCLRWISTKGGPNRVIRHWHPRLITRDCII